MRGISDVPTIEDDIRKTLNERVLVALTFEQCSEHALVMFENLIQIEEDLLYEPPDAELGDCQGIDDGFYKDLCQSLGSREHIELGSPTSWSVSRSET